MKRGYSTANMRCGFTLLELTVVILVLISLISIGLFTTSKLDEWKLGRNASETLRTVYSAQRMYLADNPTAAVSGLTEAKILPYMPQGTTTMPKVKSMAGTQLGILVNVSPPKVNAGSGVVYDPSGDSKDSLWDVGQ